MFDGALLIWLILIALGITVRGGTSTFYRKYVPSGAVFYSLILSFFFFFLAAKQVEANSRWCEETNYIGYLSSIAQYLAEYIPAIPFLQNSANLPGIVFRCTSEIFMLQILIFVTTSGLCAKILILLPAKEIEQNWVNFKGRQSRFSYIFINVIAPIIFVGLGWWIWYDGGGYRPKTVRGALLSWGSTYSFFIGMGCFVILQIRTYCHCRKKAKAQTQVKGGVLWEVVVIIMVIKRRVIQAVRETKNRMSIFHIRPIGTSVA